MNLTQKQLEALKEECPKCFGTKKTPARRMDCRECKGTGKATILIEKEWVEYQTPQGKINYAKYKVGDEVKEDCPLLERLPRGEIAHHGSQPNCKYDCIGGLIKLKIISETETHQKLQMVK